MMATIQWLFLNNLQSNVTTLTIQSMQMMHAILYMFVFSELCMAQRSNQICLMLSEDKFMYLFDLLLMRRMLQRDPTQVLSHS